MDKLNLLSKKKENVTVRIYTLRRTRLSSTDVVNFNAQYPSVEVKYTIRDILQRLEIETEES